MSDMDAQLKGQSGTVLEQTTSSDGLVQLVSRERKTADGPENGGCKSSGLFASRTNLTPPIGEDDEDELSRPGTSSGTPLASVLGPAQTPDIRKANPEEQVPQLPRPGETQDTESPTGVTRPTHVDLPPPPDLKSLLRPQKIPSPSANRPPQIDVTPGLQVLVVDDDKMTRMLFQRMLGRLKCQVTTAINGYEALRLVTGDHDALETPAEEEHDHPFLDGEDHLSIMEMERVKGEKECKFAIVFLDNQMPVMSGVEMVRKLRKLGRKDLVVGVTGEIFPFSRVHPRCVGVCGI
jgi:CheY-like chemotaxis protein